MNWNCCKSIRFSCDGYQLCGVLHLPHTLFPPVVIGSHGLLSSSGSPKQLDLAARCTAAGIAYFRFDHRGCGASQGAFNEVTSLEARGRDIAAAVDAVRASGHVDGRVGLFGSSMGGAACLAVAARLGVDAVATFAAPLRSRTVRLTTSTPAVEPPTGTRNVAALPPFDLSAAVVGLRRLLVIHGEADEVVPVSDALEICEKAGEPKRLIVQKNGDHAMSLEPHRFNFANETLSWFSSHLRP
jgi:alpha-beta hydrolase superfamily lysophospholipase